MLVGNILVRWITGDQPVPVHIFITQAALASRQRKMRPLVREGTGSEKLIQLDPGAVAIGAVIWPEWGYWSGRVAIPPGASSAIISCEEIKCTGALAWWHSRLGIQSSNTNRGRGIRIGVIDFGLSMECIERENITMLKGPVVPEHLEHIIHGDQVMSLMNALPAPKSFEGVAPGADYYFAPASSRIKDEGLSVAWVFEQIERLTKDHDCHLINLSAGVSDDPSGLLDEAIEIAFSRGALCVVAAGNMGPDVVYPAKSGRAIAVGAFGCSGVTPGNSQTAGLCEYGSIAKSEDGLFMIAPYSFSPDINVIAPGIGVLPSVGGRLTEQSGTSFAAPLVTGALAAILAEDEHYKDVMGTERSARALQIFEEEATSPSGIACCGAEFPTIRLPQKGC
jgi:subtilisin family serine protease